MTVDEATFIVQSFGKRFPRELEGMAAELASEMLIRLATRIREKETRLEEVLREWDDGRTAKFREH